MKTKIEVITPEMAMNWLEHHNFKNRTISQGTVDSYATDMKNGRWSLTHQGIAFNTEGQLIDGQHRLWAIVFANKNIEMMVTRDMPVTENKGGVQINPMDAVDRTRVRSTGAQMQLCHNVKNGNQVAAALRGIAYMVSPASLGRRLSTANSLFIYDLYGKDAEAVIARCETRKRVAHVTAPFSVYHHGEPEKAMALLNQIHTLEDLSPAGRMLVRYLDTCSGADNSGHNIRIVSSILMNYHQGKNISKVHDSMEGVQFLVSMFPSLNRRIRDAVKPIENQKILKFTQPSKSDA